MLLIFVCYLDISKKQESYFIGLSRVDLFMKLLEDIWMGSICLPASIFTVQIIGFLGKDNRLVAVHL